LGNDCIIRLNRNERNLRIDTRDSPNSGTRNIFGFCNNHIAMFDLFLQAIYLFTFNSHRQKRLFRHFRYW